MLDWNVLKSVAVEKVDREHQNTIVPNARDQETSKILFNRQSFLCLTHLITQSFLKQADQETSRHKLMGSPSCVLHT